MAKKQKLIELLEGFSFPVTVNGEPLSEWTIPMPQIRKALADHLLASGVTFATDTNVGSKWKPASEPPEVWRDKNGTMVNYLVYMPKYGVDVGNYMKPAKQWLCLGIPCKVTHWMPMPTPPEEGR